MPSPVSLITSSSCWPSTRVTMSICPPSWLYLTAFDSRLIRICLTRVMSPTAATVPVEKRVLMRMPRRPASPATSDTLASTRASRSRFSMLQQHVARLDARQVEHVVDHVQQVPARVLDLRHPGALPRHQRVALVEFEQLGKAEHGVQRGAQLMAHARQEFALGVVGRFGLVARTLGLHQLEVFGDVLHHTHQAARLAFAVAQQGQGGLHPHGVAVAAHHAVVAAVHGHFATQQLAGAQLFLAGVVGVDVVDTRPCAAAARCCSRSGC